MNNNLSENSIDNNSLNKSIDELETLKIQFNNLSEEKNNMETDFGFKRARFKEIMLKKEEEMRNQNEKNQQKVDALENQLKFLQNELDNNKSLLTVFQFEQENQIELVKQKHKEEVTVIRQTADENIKKIIAKHELDLEQYKKFENDFNNFKSQIKNESVLSVVTKSLKQKVGSLNATNLLSSSFDDKTINKSKENQEDFGFNLLLEEETKLLKDKLRSTDKLVRVYEQILKLVANNMGINKLKEWINSAIENPEILNDFKEKYSNNQLNNQLNNEDIILLNLIFEKTELQNELDKLNQQKKQTKENLENNSIDQCLLKKNELKKPKFKLNKIKRSQSLILFNQNEIINKCDGSIKSLRALEQENHNLKLRLNKPCEMCLNYELQLQTVQLSESETLKKLEHCEKKLEHHVQETILEQEHHNQLEESFTQEAKEIQDKLEKQQTKLATFNYELEELKIFIKKTCYGLNENIKKVAFLNERLKKDLKIMFYENDILLGKYVAKSKKLQAEAIDLPQDLNEMQFYCLKIREDLISVSLAKERLEDRFHKELRYLKEKQESDSLTEKILNESLKSDNNILKNDLKKSRIELDNLKAMFEDVKKLYENCQMNLNNAQAQFNPLQLDLQKKINSLTENKKHLENENTNLKCKLQNLQMELDNSETVQRDFVKLSQSLQIQLEKIRQADFEVRWQHEDDVCECNNCKKNFHSKREKNHCSHCGKIFCSDCNNKIVLGGPNRRQFKVCHVCHTLLDRETAPYFSSEVPQSPTLF